MLPQPQTRRGEDFPTSRHPPQRQLGQASGHRYGGAAAQGRGDVAGEETKHLGMGTTYAFFDVSITFPMFLCFLGKSGDSNI